jgi:hypothetical protein
MSVATPYTGVPSARTISISSGQVGSGGAGQVGALNQLGVEMEATNNCPPVEIFAKGLPGGKTKIAGDISSQFLSALLMVAPYAQSEIEITLSTELNSKPYVDMTIAIMKDFGVESERHGYERFTIHPSFYFPLSSYAIESDASAAIALGGGRTLVLVDGVRLNDAQSGHHNGDIPVPLEAVERIEILQGPGSAIFGADAFGGTVNVITRRTAPASVQVRGGADDYAGGSGQWAFERGGASQLLSASADRSSGFMYDRDFKNAIVRSRTSFGRSTVSLSYLWKGFGANNFYGGNAPSREWTNQTLLAAELVARVRRFDLEVYDHQDVLLFYARTGDKRDIFSQLSGGCGCTHCFYLW